MKHLKFALIGLVLLVLLAPAWAMAGSNAADAANTYATPVAVDTLIWTGPAFVKYLTCSPTDNAAVAGTIQLRDAVAAGAGTIAVEWTVLAIDYTVAAPKVFPVNATFATGIYLDFTTTSDVKCWVTYRP